MLLENRCKPTLSDNNVHNACKEAVLSSFFITRIFYYLVWFTKFYRNVMVYVFANKKIISLDSLAKIIYRATIDVIHLINYARFLVELYSVHKSFRGY